MKKLSPKLQKEIKMCKYLLHFAVVSALLTGAYYIYALIKGGFGWTEFWITFPILVLLITMITICWFWASKIEKKIKKERDDLK